MHHSHATLLPVCLLLLIASAACTAFSQNATEDDGRTYHVSPAGDDSHPGTARRPWRSIQKAADTLRAGDQVLIRGGTYGERVTVNHSGGPDGPISFLAADGEAVVIDGGGLTPSGRALFDTNGHDHLRIVGLTVQNAERPRVGILVRDSSHVAVERCRTFNTAHSGINVWSSDHVTVSHNEIERACQRGGEESLSIKISEHVVAGHNHIHHTGHEGIDVKEGSRHVRVHDNHVHDVDRQGLYVDSWDRPTYDVRFYNNRVHDCGFGVVVGAETGGVLSDVWYYNNLIYNNRGPGMVIADWGRPGSGHPMRDVHFVNNTVVNNGRDGHWGGGMWFENAEAENVVVRNNILSGNTRGQIVVQNGKGPASAVISHNLIDGTSELPGENSVTAAPRFVDAARGDFLPQSNSSAVDAGTAEHAPETDFTGRRRDCGAGVDLGALEYCD